MPGPNHLRQLKELGPYQPAPEPAPRAPVPASGGSDSTGFVIESETTMLEIPRGRTGDQLRLTFTKATTPDGKATAWHSLRVYFRAQDGTMRPTKTGVTIRGAELAPVLRALATAAGAKLVNSSGAEQ